jgi:penicillin-binding protein 1A
VASKKTNKTAPKRKPTQRKKKGKQQDSKKFKFLKITGKIAAVLFLLGALFFILVFLGVFGPVPSKQQLHQINNPVASEVYSADGKIIGRYYVENRSNVTFDEISPNIINALIATEDSRFYEHRGIDELALLRVLVKSILMHNKSSGGGSTISQQIAKNLYPRVDYGPFSLPVNKLREAIIAYRLERIYDKHKILAMYLNTVPFAENIFGIEVASERFFSKKPAKLTVNEAAVLVGMLKANNYYNPRTHPERAKKRRNIVINQMVKYEYITEDEAKKYKGKPLDIKYRVISYNRGPAPYFLEKLKPQLLDWCENNYNENDDNYNLFTDGLKIKTTIDYNLQYYAQQSVKEYMKKLQTVFDNRWKSRDMFKQNPAIIKSAILKNKRSEANYAKILNQYNEKKATTLFTWNGLNEKNITRLDSLKHYLKLLNAGFMALDPHSGELKAWVGGIDFRFFKYDHVTAPRQTGSAFKPFVYLAALENGVEADKYYTNQYKVYKEYKNWAPRNSHNRYGGFYSMKGALAKSLNTVSVEVLLDAGIDETIELAEDLGISAELPEYPSLALGVASISLKEMVEAYAAIVNDGKPIQTHYLLEIADRNGNVLQTFEYEQEDEPVVEPENCRAVINMMEAVVNNGTGRGIRTIYKINSNFAGKTGTTQNNSDGWFIGLTPNLVTGCWVGADDPRVHFRSTTYGQGAYMALPIVGKFFHKTYSDPKFTSLKNSSFTQPNPEMLALLNKAQFREVLDIEKRKFDITAIFKKKEDNNKLQKNKVAKVQKKRKKERKFWNKVRNIFRKKKKK